MPDLPYQTFGSTNRVFVGADATITTKPASNGEFVHNVDISDFRGGPVLSLCLTEQAAGDLYGVLAALVGHSWADAQIAPADAS